LRSSGSSIFPCSRRRTNPGRGEERGRGERPNRARASGPRSTSSTRRPARSWAPDWPPRRSAPNSALLLGRRARQSERLSRSVPGSFGVADDRAVEVVLGATGLRAGLAACATPIARRRRGTRIGALERSGFGPNAVGGASIQTPSGINGRPQPSRSPIGSGFAPVGRWGIACYARHGLQAFPALLLATRTSGRGREPTRASIRLRRSHRAHRKFLAPRPARHRHYSIGDATTSAPRPKRRLRPNSPSPTLSNVVQGCRWLDQLFT
jgi:hypothetical protein